MFSDKSKWSLVLKNITMWNCPKLGQLNKTNYTIMYAISISTIDNTTSSKEYVEMTHEMKMFDFELDKSTNLFLLGKGDLSNVYRAIEYLASLKWLKPILSDIHVMKIDSYSDFTEIVKSRS